ncbi:MAG: hypothetical protein ACKO23_09825 [Gemmataceae bacterium]
MGRAGEQGFRLHLHQITFQEFEEADPTRFDLIVPLGLPAVEFLSAHPGWAPRNPLASPPLECVRLCDDKLALNRRLIQEGHADLIPRLGPGLSMPYIIKKSTDGHGINTHLVRNREDEQRFGHLLHDPDYFTQEVVEGFQEYAAHMVIRDGKLVCQMTIQHNLPTTMSIRGVQAKVTSSRVCRNHFTDRLVAVLNVIGYEGLCCINYKIIQGQAKLLEINPRIGSSLCPFLFSFVPAIMRGAKAG